MISTAHLRKLKIIPIPLSQVFKGIGIIRGLDVFYYRNAKFQIKLGLSIRVGVVLFLLGNIRTLQESPE